MPYNFDALSLSPIIEHFLSDDITVLDQVRQGKILLTTGQDTGIARKAFLEASSGKFVLKEFPFYANDLTFANDVTHFQELLRTRFDIPIPQFSPTRANPEDYHVIIQEPSQSIFTLQKMVTGAPAERGTEAAISAAEVLGRLHAASHILNFTKDKYAFSKESIFTTTLKLLERGKKEIIAGGRFPVDRFHLLEDLSKTFEDYVNHNRDSSVSRGYDGKCIAVHGDSHINNFLFDGKYRVTAVLDFDDVKYDNPVHDVARLANSVGLFDFVTNPERPFDLVPSTIDIDIMELVLERYLDQFEAYKKNTVACYSSAIKCLAIQVAFIGLLSGGYSHEQVNALMELPNILDRNIPASWMSYEI